MQPPQPAPERLLARNLVFAGRIFRVYVDEVEGPRGRATRELVDHPGAVAVLPLRDDGLAVLLRQYRHAAGRALLEIPAGRLEPGEDPEAAALRELKEETGYVARRLRRLACVYASPGFCNERLFLFVADGLSPGASSPEDDEHIVEAVPVTRAQAAHLVAAGAVEDAKTLIALLWWLLGVPEA